MPLLSSQKFGNVFALFFDDWFSVVPLYVGLVWFFSLLVPRLFGCCSLFDCSSLLVMILVGLVGSLIFRLTCNKL